MVSKAFRHVQTVAAGTSSPANDNFVVRLPVHGTLQHVSSILSSNSAGPVNCNLQIWDESVTSFTWYGSLATGTLHTGSILASDSVSWDGALDLVSLIHAKLYPAVTNDTGSSASVITVAYVDVST